MDKLLWINEDISFMFRANIVEYDMQTASLAVSERYKLLDPILLEQLRNSPKHDRVVKIGLMQRDNKEFSDRMLQGIIDTRQEFLKQNHVDEDDILALHSDAIVFNMQSPRINTSVDNVKFIRKGQWTSYIQYEGVEIYHNDGIIDIKGIPKDISKQHTLGMIKFLQKIFGYLEACDDTVLSYIRKFQKRYYQDKLQEFYYKSFPKIGEYKTNNLKFLAFMAQVIAMDMREWWYR